MTTTSVLYDNPGPRARRTTAIGTVIALIVIAVVVVLALIQLGNRGQLDGAK